MIRPMNISRRVAHRYVLSSWLANKAPLPQERCYPLPSTPKGLSSRAPPALLCQLTISMRSLTCYNLIEHKGLTVSVTGEEAPWCRRVPVQNTTDILRMGGGCFRKGKVGQNLSRSSVITSALPSLPKANVHLSLD